ncbi:hypothetical protein ACHQM5_002362 [Ranunculus cassubicifolius]
MATVKSSLNPNASSYIPLCKQGIGEEDVRQTIPGKAVIDATTANIDEEASDLAYLATTFPGVSDQSVAAVYSATGCDLEASVDMIKQLELPAESTTESLPDSLDIGDVAESGSSKLISDQATGSSTAA